MDDEDIDTPLRLLSLDGGGVRGLSSLLILEQLMISIDPNNELRPCDYFDMIAGTSTGGIIAIMLGRLQMSVADCIKAYGALSGSVFEKSKRLPLWAIYKKLLGLEQFRSERLEQEITNLLGDYLSKDERDGHLTPRSVPLLEPRPNRKVKCKVFVVTAQYADGHRCRLRSYRAPAQVDQGFTIVEAARATSAAPMIFKALVKIDGAIKEKFVDGGLGYNNPVQQLLNESRVIWPERQIGCLLSIGTGSRQITQVGRRLTQLAKKCAQITTDADKTAFEFEQFLSHANPEVDRVYFRFTVNRGLEGTKLEEWKEMGLIKQRTQTYLIENEMKIKRCTTLLKAPAYAACEQLSCEQLSFEDPDDFQKIYDIPQISVCDLVEREPMVAKVDSAFRMNSDNAQKIAISGPKGQGKTQLALEYVKRKKRAYHGIFWVDATNKETAKRGFFRISRILGIQLATDVDSAEVIESVWAFLRKVQIDWLIVFDNVNDLSGFPDIEDFFCRHWRGKFLIITRDSSCASKLGDIDLVELDPFSPEEAVELLLKRSGKTGDDLKSDDLKSDAAKIVKELNYSPAEIDRAGTYIKYMYIDFPTYLKTGIPHDFIPPR